MHALSSGLAGALVLTAAHETLRRFLPDAPRMDIVGARALSGAMRSAGHEPPQAERLYAATMAGDVISNAVYYSAISNGGRRGLWGRAAVLGLAAGLGAVYLPRPLGLGDPPHSEHLRNRLLTVALYLAGAFAAAAAARRTSGDYPDEREPVVGYDRKWLRRG